MLKIQALANADRELYEGEIPRRKSCADEVRDANPEMLSTVKYGNLLINTEIYPCLKRACVTLDSICKSRIGECRSRGKDIRNSRPLSKKKQDKEK